jgi:CrcB protein
LVNLVASFALGMIVAAADPWPTIVGIGALGALSTWSTVANEAAAMSREDRGAMALAYLGLTVSSGVLAAWFGLQLGPVVF